jgi:uncharacterized protein (TIGR02246 family)
MNLTTPHSSNESEIRSLYRQLLDSWNQRSAGGFAALIAEAGYIVGFDGSTSNGQAEIEAALEKIFAHHQTPAFIGKIRSVHFPVPEVAIVSAVAGMVPSGEEDINPALNAIQTLVAHRSGESWRIAVFQNTPATFHGRPELAEQLTAELRQALLDRPVDLPA